jgi:small subunit ribosomal protein S4
MRYRGPKNRIARREGVDLGLRAAGTKSHGSLLKKLNVLPGQHGVRRRRKFSERGRQLRETQKIKFIFGLSNKQLKNYFRKAVKKTGNTASFLSQFLEKRLDNIVYRLGFALTRAHARQLVSHKHIMINNRSVNIPSYQVEVNDLISFNKDITQKIPDVGKAVSIKDLILPFWLERKAVIGKLIAEPNSELIEKQINLRLVIEYFSR